MMPELVAELQSQAQELRAREEALQAVNGTLEAQAERSWASTEHL